MGAVSALLFAARNTSISLIVLDSPFKDFAQLLKEYINRFKVRRRDLHKLNLHRLFQFYLVATFTKSFEEQSYKKPALILSKSLD